MSDEASNTVWLVCPKCRSRREVEKDQLEQRILCRQCSTPLVAGSAEPSDQPVVDERASSQSAAPVVDLADDELLPEPPSERIEVYRAALEAGLEKEIPHEDWVAPPERGALTWAFFSGVFSYAWWPNALGKWIFLAVTLSIVGLVAGLIPLGMAVGGEMGIVSAGCFALVAFMIGLFALSYGAACMVDIIVNTAYNNDKADDWPDVDWRERLVVFVRVGYLLVWSIVPAAAIAELLSLTPLGAGQVQPIIAIATFVLFPIILLSSMEADSIWPLSAPTWRSLVIAWQGWAVYYAAAAALALGVAIITAAAIAAFGRLGPLIFCPVAAAALFSYARLLGRLAWFIRHREGDDARVNVRYADRSQQSDE